MKTGLDRFLLGTCACLLALACLATPASAVEYSQTHDPLELMVGFPSWGFDTGWMGANLGVVAAYLRFNLGIGGTVLDLELNGQGKLTYPTAVQTGQLWFQGSTGSAAENVGVEMHGQYKIVVAGLEYVGNLPYVPQTDLRLMDSKGFAPYLPDNIVLQDQIDNQKLYTFPIGVAGIFAAEIGVSITAGDRFEIDFKSLDTDKGNFLTDFERKNVSVTTNQLTVGDIHEMVGIVPTVTLLPIAVVGITVGPFHYDINIPTFTINVPLASLLQPEYPTTPSRTITFYIAPVLNTFVINGGAAETMGRVITITNSCWNNPTHYMASEDPAFAGAPWIPYASSAQFLLSDLDGLKTVYFKVKNSSGESAVLSDSILLNRTAPTVNALSTIDPTPPLSGSVHFPAGLVSITVGTQTRTAVNNGSGGWTLADNVLSSLSSGTYDVQVTVTDALGNILHDATTNELVIDSEAPVVTVNSLRTSNTRPLLSGTVTDNMEVATVLVTVDGHTYTAAVAGGTWTAQVVYALAQGTYDVQAAATDLLGNIGTDPTVNELEIDFSAIMVTVDPLVTMDTTPPLSGTVDEPTASMVVTVMATPPQSVPAVNHGDGTWTVADNALNPLADGIYNVVAAATTMTGRHGTDLTTNELTIDVAAPVATVNLLTTNDTTPGLTGTVTDTTHTLISVMVPGQTVMATDNGDGTWTLADNLLSPLAEGVYDVHVTAMDAVGHIGHDTTINELTIDTTPPVVTVDSLITNDTTPALFGGVDGVYPSIWVTVGTQTRQGINVYGQNRWSLPDGRLSPLPQGTYDVEVRITDNAGNVGVDTTHYELTIDTTPPTCAVSLMSSSPTGLDAIPFRVEFNEPVGTSFNTVTLTGSLAGAASFSINNADPVYVVTVTPNDPAANGTVGIQIGTGVHDLAGNAFAGASSPLCTVENWRGFGSQPQDARIYSGDSHVFTASAGCGLSVVTYLWKWEDEGHVVHNGPTTTTWSIIGATEAQGGQYWCEASYDGTVHSSSVATLSVADHLGILQQPEGATKFSGSAHTFSIVTSGGFAPLRYTWKKDGSPLLTATDVATTIDPLDENDTGTYWVEVADDNVDVRVSDSASLVVLANMPVAGVVSIGILIGAGALIYMRRRR